MTGLLTLVTLADGPLARTPFSWAMPAAIGILFAVTLFLIGCSWVAEAWRSHRAGAAQPIAGLAE